MARGEVDEPRQPAAVRGRFVGKKVGIGDDEELARRRLDPALVGGEVLVAAVPDDALEALGVGAQPLACLRTRDVVDDCQAVRPDRVSAPGIDHATEVVDAVVGEQDDVDDLTSLGVAIRGHGDPAASRCATTWQQSPPPQWSTSRTTGKMHDPSAYDAHIFHPNVQRPART